MISLLHFATFMPSVLAHLHALQWLQALEFLVSGMLPSLLNTNIKGITNVLIIEMLTVFDLFASDHDHRRL
jgi:hypothetical protein